MTFRKKVLARANNHKLGFRNIETEAYRVLANSEGSVVLS